MVRTEIGHRQAILLIALDRWTGVESGCDTADVDMRERGLPVRVVGRVAGRAVEQDRDLEILRRAGGDAQRRNGAAGRENIDGMVVAIACREIRLPVRGKGKLEMILAVPVRLPAGC